MASSSTSTKPLHRDQPAAKDGKSNGTEGDARRRQLSSPQGTTRERRTGRVEVREILAMRIRSPDRQTRLTPNQPEQAGAAEVKPKRSSQPKSSRSNASNLPWNPAASLIPHTTAPLASRMSIPPRASHAPASLQPRALQELSLEAQEAAIIEDLLMVLMGFRGQYIHFAKSYDPSIEKARLVGPDFIIYPGLDPSLRDLTIEVLKMATHYNALEAFIEVQGRAESGVVNHALSAAIRKLTHEYLVLIAQLETQFLTSPSFSLNVMNLHILSTMHAMRLVYSLSQAILNQSFLTDEDKDFDERFDMANILETLQDGGDLEIGSISKKICKGGKVLGLISKRLEISSGDPAARTILTSLLQSCSRPYMRMLNEWLHHGTIKDDLHMEFLVKEQKSIRREGLSDDYVDDYWDRRYTLRDDVPPQLESVQQKVLLAGKYLNVVRECGGVDIVKAISNAPATFEDPRFFDNINDAYGHANKSLLNLLLTTYALPARLDSMKHYFFLSQSDFMSHFVDIASSELRKPVEKVNMSKLQSLLDIVLPAQDPFKENLKVEMNSASLIDSLTRVINISGVEDGEKPLNPTIAPLETDNGLIGFTSLQLDCLVPFPASLVISRKTIWRYQALFRFLFSLRYLEQQLVANWQILNKAASWSHKSSNEDIELCKRHSFILRARMLVYVQQLLYFCTSEVIEPNWQDFMEKLKDASTSNDATVDQLMKSHVEFLDTCMKECTLTNARLITRHTKIIQTCTHFSNYTAWLSRELENNDPDLSGETRPSNMHQQQWSRFQADKMQSSTKPTGSGTTAPQLEKMVIMVKKFEINFERHMHLLRDELNHYAATETVVLLGLCARLSSVY